MISRALGALPKGYSEGVYEGTGGQFLFHLVSRLYERTSIVVTPNLAFGEWPRKFFAVSASVFLYAKGAIEPFTRSKIKEKQPEYYNYLVWLFGFDPDRKPGVPPLASAT